MASSYAMREHYDWASVFGASPALNHALIAAALLCAIGSFFIASKAQKLLNAACVIALCMPIYDLGAIIFASPSALFAVFIFLWFAPTNLILIYALLIPRKIKNVRGWAITIFLSIIMSWLGVTFLYFVVS